MAKRHVTQLKESRKCCPKNSTTCAIGAHTQPKCDAFAISTAAGIIIDKYRRVEALRESIIGHHQMVKDYDHDYPDLHAHTFSHLTVALSYTYPM
jgi:hypothetical protein